MSGSAGSDHSAVDRSDASQPPSAAIPEAAVARLAGYQFVLRKFSERGAVIASSVELATAAGVNPAILRKDLSYVGANGVRGVGYDVSRLTARIKLALHTDSTHTVALAGASRLGHALISHTGFGRGFRVSALFDADPGSVGTRFDGGLVVAPLADIEQICGTASGASVDIGVVATADDDAQTACDAFVAAGVRQILNVTTAPLSVPEGVVVRHVDLALELQVLGFAAHAVNTSDPGGRIVSRRDNEPVMGEETVTA